MDDRTLRDDVIEALDFQPSVTATNIGVSVHSNVVTLSGHVNSYAEKIAAAQCTQRVRGVKAVAEELVVRYPFDKQIADDQIAQRALHILEWDWNVPKDAIKVKVQQGSVTMTGQVPWYYQKLAAERAVRKLSGVVLLNNDVTVATQANTSDVEAKIKAAFRRDAELEGNAIRVSVEKDKVRLEGKVKAYRERTLAQNAAWSIPGVTRVEDLLVVA